MKATKFSSRREYWKTLINEQKASGLSQAKFCESRGISRGSFYQWSAILKRGAKRDLVRVEVGQPAEQEPMRIVFQSGVALHFAVRPEPEWIVELMRLVS